MRLRSETKYIVSSLRAAIFSCNLQCHSILGAIHMSRAHMSHDLETVIIFKFSELGLGLGLG